MIAPLRVAGICGGSVGNLSPSPGLALYGLINAARATPVITRESDQLLDVQLCVVPTKKLCIEGLS